jgi:septum formation protein
MRALDATALGLYLDAAGSGVLGSVGVYQWEGLGVHLFERVAGDHTTILGLPMLKLLAALRRLGVLKI